MKSLVEYVNDYEYYLLASNNIIKNIKMLDNKIIDEWLFNTDIDDRINIINFINPEHYAEIIQCNNDSNILNNNTLNNIVNNAYQLLLYERLGESLSVHDPLFIKHLLQVFDGININSDIAQNKHKYQMVLNVPNSFDYEDKQFKSFLNLFNYFILNISESSTPNSYNITIQARRPKDCTELSLPFVYHITNQRVSDKIIKFGLIPKNKQEYQTYSPRVYAMSSKIDDVGLQMTIFSLYHFKKKQYPNIDVLKIDTAQFAKDKGYKLKFFGDPSSNSNQMLFTLEPIPAKYISLYKSFKI